jgi:hypothetical protein
MILYKVFLKNYDLKKGELIGILPERRKDLRGTAPAESGLRWAKSVFSDLVKDKHGIFIVPKEVKERRER